MSQPTGLPLACDQLKLGAPGGQRYPLAVHQLQWTVSLHLDIARWPDWKQDPTVIVHP